MTMQTTEVSLKNHYAGIRARLFNTKPKEPAQIRTVQVAKVVPLVTKRLPAWQAEDVHFDSHVQLWRAIIRSIMSSQSASCIAQNLEERDRPFIEIQVKKPIKDIVDGVLVHFQGMTWDCVTSAVRTKRFILPRHLCMYEVRKQRRDLSAPVLGRIFRRDHTVILHAVQKIEAMRASGELAWYFGEESKDA